jgi:pimeloyl-ACP methyl ester carboxylesterase
MTGKSAPRVAASEPMTTPLASRSDFLPIGEVRYHVRRWGNPEAPMVFLLHGWMDVSASFQFLVDAWQVRGGAPVQFVAPDWRGFGESTWLGRPYWFPDYLVDLDRLLAHYSPEAPATLVGHSMGGIVACLYAGTRPERIHRLATLEGIGITATAPEAAPDRYGRWLDEAGRAPRMHRYADRGTFATKLAAEHASLTAQQLAHLAVHLGREVDTADGPRIVHAGDPWHKLVNPVLYRIQEAEACWRRITSPVLHVRGEDEAWLLRLLGSREELLRREACFANLRSQVLPGAGHMLHWQAPEALAGVLADFLS